MLSTSRIFTWVDCWRLHFFILLQLISIGLPSAPILDLSPDLTTLEVLYFSIRPPQYAAPCVEYYTIYQLFPDGSNATVLVVNNTANMENVSMSGYRLCTDMLMFFVVPFSSSGMGEPSNVSYHGPLNMSGR